MDHNIWLSAEYDTLISDPKQSLLLVGDLTPVVSLQQRRFLFQGLPFTHCHNIRNVSYGFIACVEALECNIFQDVTSLLLQEQIHSSIVCYGWPSP